MASAPLSTRCGLGVTHFLCSRLTSSRLCRVHIAVPQKPAFHLPLDRRERAQPGNGPDPLLEQRRAWLQWTLRDGVRGAKRSAPCSVSAPHPARPPSFEHGPFLAQADGGLLPNPFSWNKNATVVYFEQPAGVGFSYSSNPADYDRYSDDIAAADNAAFLTSFFNLYPQYQNLPLFLTSESCEYLLGSGVC